MAKGTFEAWELADITRMLKAEEREREEREEEMADPESRLLQEAAILLPPSPRDVQKIKSLME